MSEQVSRAVVLIGAVELIGSLFWPMPEDCEYPQEPHGWRFGAYWGGGMQEIALFDQPGYQSGSMADPITVGEIKLAESVIAASGATWRVM